MTGSPYRTKTGFLSRYEALGDVTMRWIIDEIKPMIDTEYRTLPGRECTAIAGSSMGGLMSAYAVIRYNEVFSKAACVSSSIVFCLRQMLSEFDHKSLDPDTRVYLSWGTCEARGVTNPDIEDISSYAYKCNKAFASRIKNAPHKKCRCISNDVLSDRRSSLRGRLGEADPDFYGLSLDALMAGYRKHFPESP